MNREQACNYLRSSGFSEEQIKAIEGAFKSQPKSECEHDHEILKAHSDGANEVLAIIRAEIAKEAKCTMNDNRAGGLYKALQIIDKYAEGSGKE